MERPVLKEEPLTGDDRAPITASSTASTKKMEMVGDYQARAALLMANARPDGHHRLAAKWRRWAVRLDVLCGLVATIVLVSVVGWQLFRFLPTPQPGDAKGLGAPIITGSVAILVACVGGIVKITSARQNLITLFSSEIRAIQFGLTVMQMFPFWAEAHARPELGRQGWADAPRTSDYFEIFHAASGTLVNQHPNVVESIVRFYTYFKMSRDAAAAVAGWQEPPDLPKRKRDVEHVVRLLALSMFWGYIARSSMGQLSDASDVDQLHEMVGVMNDVLGPSGYPEMFDLLPRKEALEEFFGVT
jgi:hypothetical protein